MSDVESEQAAGAIVGRNLIRNIRQVNIQHNMTGPGSPIAAVGFQDILGLAVLAPIHGDFFVHCHR